MTTLRVPLKKLGFQKVDHPGLRLGKYLPCQSSDPDFEPQKAAFLRSFLELDGGKAYRSYFERFQNELRNRRTRMEVWAARYRVAFGLGDENVLEIGLRLHHTYGLPVISGSALKGLAYRFAKNSFGVDEATASDLFGTGGHDGAAGSLVFHDALWVPEDKPFVLDTTTVHHPQYYQGNEPPSDWDSPTPLLHLTAKGKFLFALEGAPEVVDFAFQVLGAALADWGIGARTLKGYGRFETGVSGTGAVGNPAWGSSASCSTSSSMETTAEGATVILDPGPGIFKVSFQLHQKNFTGSCRALPAVFPDVETFEAAKAGCKKKRQIKAKIRYRAEGNSITILEIIPE